MRFDFTRRQWLTLIVISIADFCNAICVALQAPFFPHEAELKGCSSIEYGLVFGIFELAVFVVSPFYGAHLNRLGPKLVFNAGILTTATCAILFGFLDKVDGHIPFVTLAFTIRIIEALGNAAFLTASFAIIAKEFPNNVATMFASLETFFGLGLIVGPMLGGVLYSWGGYSLPFAVLGSALFATAIMCYVTLPKTSDDEDIKPTGQRDFEKNFKRSPKATMFSLLKIPGVLMAAISIILTSISIGFLQATLEPHLRQFGFSPVVLGVIFIINGGVYALTAPGWGWLCDHPTVKPKYITCIGHLFVVAAFLLIGPAPFFDMPTILWVTIVGLVLHGFGMGSLLVSTFTDSLGTAISSGLPNSIETYGLVSGMWTSTFALGAFIGPTVSGLLFHLINFRNSTVFIVVLHFIMAVLLCFLCTCDRYKMEVSVSAGDLLRLDGTLDESVLIGEKFMIPTTTRQKSRHYGISVEKSRPPGMNSLIACSSYKNRRSPWSQRTPRYRPSYGSLDARFRAT
ncbi:MFS-type transporter SLC18B1-like isoform X2 [Aricia agestis]|uniref:MFS-type transporter SLC18B1-like isoform X2 n=1 Tax=Aricia agestis TaxID=91739 RepID=UPI001C20AE0F|nr:MFS-type transporter SLC18B1-like isoform X2 [Aricia agestis]